MPRLPKKAAAAQGVWHGPQSPGRQASSVALPISLFFRSLVRDLTLFRILAQRAYDDPELPELLRVLAEATPRDRVPFFAGLLEILDEGPTALHPAALNALAGADGYLGVRTIVRHLEDATEPALAALKRAAEANPSRWAHAIFHPNDAVRVAAATMGAPEHGRHLELHLVGDVATRAIVLGRKLPARKTDVVPVLDFARDGLLTRDAAREILVDADIEGWLESSRARAPERCTQFLASALRPEGPDRSILDRADDDLDDLFELFVEDEASFHKLLKRAGELFDDHAARCATALVRILVGPRGLVPWVLAAALRAELNLVRAPWIERGARRTAAFELYSAIDDPMKPEDTILPILFDPICSHEDGGPDLAVIGAVLSRLNDYYYKSAVRWIGRRSLEAAFATRPEDSARFFFATENDLAHKIAFLDFFPSTRARRRALVTFAAEAPLPVLDMLAECDRLDVAHVLAELVPRRITPARAEALATPLVRRIGPEGTAEALATWRGRPRPDGQGDLARSLLFASAREHEVNAWVAAFVKAPCLPFVLDLIDREPTFQYGKEIALAHALSRSSNGIERAWAERRVRPEEAPPPAMPIKGVLARDVATARVDELPKLLAGISRGGATGAVDLLSRRTDHTASVAATVALLASPDPVVASAPLLVRYASDEPRFVHEVDVDLVARFSGSPAELSLFGHGWLWRWERHAKKAVDDMCTLHGSLAGALAAFRSLPWDRGRQDLFAAAACWLAVTSARDGARYLELVSPMLVEALILALPRPEGPWAAEALVTIARHKSTSELAARRLGEIRLLLPDLCTDTRDRHARFVDAG